MKQIKETQQATDYLKENFPKGNKCRGHAMVLLALGIIAGRKEMELILNGNKNKDKTN